MEILRDFLEATRASGKKTRIIGLANLNPSSFQFYRQFCLSRQLIEEAAGGYRLTKRADQALAAIDRVVARGTELDAALTDLHRHVGRTLPGPPRPGEALRWVSRVAWQEVVGAAVEETRPEAPPPNRPLLVEFPTSPNLTWLESTSGARAIRLPPALPSSSGPPGPARRRNPARALKDGEPL